MRGRRLQGRTTLITHTLRSLSPLSSWCDLSGADVSTALRTGRPMRLARDRFEWREIDGEIVVLDLRTATYLAVGGAGAVIWPALAEGATVDQLAETVLETFEVAPSQAAADVEIFLGELAGQGVLEVARPHDQLD